MSEEIVKRMLLMERRIQQLEMAEMPSGVQLSTANVSATPTNAELDSAFGQPATLGRRFIGIVDDAGGGTTYWLCMTDETNWLIEQLAVA